MKPIKVNAVPVQPITLSVVYNNGEGYEITLHEYLSRITSRIATLEHQVEMLSKPDDGETVTTAGDIPAGYCLKEDLDGQRLEKIAPPQVFTVEEVRGLQKQLLEADALGAGYKGIFDNFLKEPK